jgi:hypothetical protein
MSGFNPCELYVLFEGKYKKSDEGREPFGGKNDYNSVLKNKNNIIIFTDVEEANLVKTDKQQCVTLKEYLRIVEYSAKRQQVSVYSGPYD